jgi:hypothetical protein
MKEKKLNTVGRKCGGKGNYGRRERKNNKQERNERE